MLCPHFGGTKARVRLPPLPLPAGSHQVLVAPFALQPLLLFGQGEWFVSTIPHHVCLILKGEKADLVFLLLWKNTGKCFSAGNVPLPTSLQKNPSPDLCCHRSCQGAFMLAQAEGGSCWCGFSWKWRKKSQSEKNHFIPAWEWKPRTYSPPISPAKSIQPPTWRVGRLGRGAQSVPLIHWWDQTTALVPGIVKLF